MGEGGTLAGIRVLDFCWIGAGALVTKALAELGADVIRVESRTRPDNLRVTPPFRPGTEGGLEASGYFASRNPGKRSFALNMRHPDARGIALDLAARCDIVTSNFRPGVMERWGMSYEEVRAVNEAIIYLVMPMQGSDGPHAGFIGFGSTIAALSGLVHLSGVPGRIPVGTGTHYPDHVPNPGHALVGLLAALLHRRRTGEGQLVELSQLESTVNVIGPAVLAVSAGVPVERSGDRMAGVVPRRAFATADGSWVVIACRTDEQRKALASALDIEMPADREEAAEAMVAEAVARLDCPSLLDSLHGAGVPAERVNSSRDILADRRLVERGFWYEVDHPVIGTMPMFRLPFRSEGGRTSTPSRPPLLGEHTWEVASSLLGMDRGDFDRLTEEGVLE
jgi:benzylsuccinate CoA-transferase BbsF subunit